MTVYWPHQTRFVCLAFCVLFSIFFLFALLFLRSFVCFHRSLTWWFFIHFALVRSFSIRSRSHSHAILAEWERETMRETTARVRKGETVEPNWMWICHSIVFYGPCDSFSILVSISFLRMHTFLFFGFFIERTYLYSLISTQIEWFDFV